MYTGRADGLVIKSQPTEVIVEGYLKFKFRGEIIGKVDATFDFSVLPERLHQLAIQCFYRPRTILLPKDGIW